MNWDRARRWSSLIGGIFSALGGLAAIADLVGVILDFFRGGDDC